jgi:hypothetical protein
VNTCVCTNSHSELPSDKIPQKLSLRRLWRMQVEHRWKMEVVLSTALLMGCTESRESRPRAVSCDFAVVGRDRRCARPAHSRQHPCTQPRAHAFSQRARIAAVVRDGDATTLRQAAARPPQHLASASSLVLIHPHHSSLIQNALRNPITQRLHRGSLGTLFLATFSRRRSQGAPLIQLLPST